MYGPWRTYMAVFARDLAVSADLTLKSPDARKHPRSASDVPWMCHGAAAKPVTIGPPKMDIPLPPTGTSAAVDDSAESSTRDLEVDVLSCHRAILLNDDLFGAR